MTQQKWIWLVSVRTQIFDFHQPSLTKSTTRHLSGHIHSGDYHQECMWSFDFHSRAASPSFTTPNPSWKTTDLCRTTMPPALSIKLQGHRRCLRIWFLFVCLFVCLFRATFVAYGVFQARGWIGATAGSLYHSHSNARSKRTLNPLNEARNRTWVREGWWKSKISRNHPV